MRYILYIISWRNEPLCFLWVQYLREELSRVDELWAAARFDSLPHVVHTLTSKDREGEVQSLKEQSDVIEEVVDEVVHSYHGGFNKAIQNYSQVSENYYFFFENNVECLILIALGVSIYYYVCTNMFILERSCLCVF